jgi:hypothetical protein
MYVKTNSAHIFPLPFVAAQTSIRSYKKSVVVGEWGEGVGVCGCSVRESGKTSLYKNLSKNHVPGVKLMSLEWRNKWKFFAANFISFGVTFRLVTGGTHGMRCRQLHVVTQRVAVKWEGEILGLYHCTFITC